MTSLNAIKSISIEIYTYIITNRDASPHTVAHTVATNYPNLGAAFYRMVAEAAREAR